MRVGRWTFAALLLVAAPAAASDWTLRRDEEGVRVWTRPVPGSAYHEFKGSVVARAGVERIRAAIEDAAHHPLWFFRCSEARVLERASPNEGWTYSVLALPWPFAPRDSIAHWRMRQDAAGAVRIEMENAPRRIPAQGRRVRVERLSGLWEIAPRPPDRAEITFQMHFEAGGSLPAWIANTSVVDMPYWSLYRLRERVESGVAIDGL
jgi:hypothetical protein